MSHDYGREVANGAQGQAAYAPQGLNPAGPYNYAHDVAAKAPHDAAAKAQRLRPQITDREVHLVTGILLDLRHSPCGDIDLARTIIDRLDDLRFG